MLLTELEIDRKSYKPVSNQIEEYLRKKITNKDIKPGTRLPTTQEMVATIQVSNHTIRQAIRKLESEGIVESTRGRGTFVLNQDKVKNGRAVSQVSKNILNNIAVASAFKGDPEKAQIMHPRTIAGIFDKCKAMDARCHLVHPNIGLESPEEVCDELLRGDYDGVIWLYPKAVHLPTIKSIVKEQIKVVVTSHSRIGINLPSVEGDEAGAGFLTVDHIISRDCPQILLFLEPGSEDMGESFQNRGGGHMSYIRAIKDTFTTVDRNAEECVDIIQVKHHGTEFQDILFHKLQTAKVGSGVILVNTKQLRKLYRENKSELDKLLGRHEVVIETDRSDNNKLNPLAEGLQFYTSIVSLGTIGQIAVQKLANLLNEQMENTTTLVGIEFKKFANMRVNK